MEEMEMIQDSVATLDRPTTRTAEARPWLGTPSSPLPVVQTTGIGRARFCGSERSSHDIALHRGAQHAALGSRTRGVLDVLLLGRVYGIHRGLGVNASHTAAVLRGRGVDAQEALFLPDQLPAKLIETLKQHRPRVAVLMALFLDPRTIAGIAAAFPRTRFYVKCHSNAQFLAGESSGWQRLLQIADVSMGLPNLSIGCASEDMTRTLQALGVKAVSLPNVYDLAAAEHARGIGKLNSGGVHIGMFGALRPFKNAIGQTCALAVAKRISGRPLVLHINGTRAEMGGANDLAQMREICQRADLRLEVHGWLAHAEFVTLAAQMHVALQVSFTETFNYVAADCVAAGTPVVGSPAIRFLPAAWKVNPDDAGAIAAAILDAPSWDVAVGQRALEAWNRWAAAKLLDELRPQSASNGSKSQTRRKLSRKVLTSLLRESRTKSPARAARKAGTRSSKRKTSASTKSKFARVVAYSATSESSSLSDDAYPL
jgi:hypothetical protein